MSYKKFDLDLLDGNQAEDLVASLFGDKTKVEVKWDKEFLRTGNVFIETHAYGRPSGINTTEADYWALVIGSRILFITPADLRYLMQFGQIKRGVGDNNAFDGVLIKGYRLLVQQTGGTNGEAPGVRETETKEA